MGIQQIAVTFNGTRSLLLNNPQMVDRFNKFTKLIAPINAKRTRRTDEDYLHLADLEVEAKTYFDDELGVYVPSRWVMAGLAKSTYKVAKISKADVRSAVSINQDKVSLMYEGMEKVKTIADIVKNSDFRHKMILPQGQIRIAKSMPIFHNWSFSFSLAFDDTVLDFDDLQRALQHSATYGGFGDFRPSFGTATAEVVSE